MKKAFKSALSFVLVCLIVASLATPASAATTAQKHTSNTYGKNVTSFYVTTTSASKTVKLNYTNTTGSFYTSTSLLGLRGYYEVLVYGVSGSSKTLISKTNIKGTRSGTLSMTGYSKYWVRVYSWNVTTIGSYRGGVWNYAGACWCSAPTCTFTAKNNVSSMYG